MSLFGGGGNSQSKLAQRSVFPDEREYVAREELRKAEEAYAAAESRLIKARRAHEDTSREWRKFYCPRQDD